MTKKDILSLTSTTILLVAIATTMFLYAGGYRIKKPEKENKKPLTIKPTGLISIKSIPQGASVYINGVLVTATNNTITGVEPGKHTIKVVKSGFAPWIKEVEVFPELATDITAVLVSQTPRLEPLTNTGAENPSISPTLSKLAFTSKNPENPGVWLVSLGNGSINLFRTSPSAILKDTPLTKYSESLSLEWSPDEKYLLIQLPDNRYQLFNINEKTTKSILSKTELEELKKAWLEYVKTKRASFIEKLEISDEIKSLAMMDDTLWAPDEKKFLYTKQKGDTIEYRVYNSEKPLPVGEKVDTLVFTTKVSDPQPKISWYSDSFHLIVVEGNIKEQKKGEIYLIRIDGTNKTEIYNNTLYSDKVFVSPDGEKIIVLTSFKSSGQTDLYTIGIR